MKKLYLALTLLLTVWAVQPVGANSVDVSISKDYYSLNVGISPDFGPWTVVADIGSETTETLIDSVGDMRAVGNKEVWEGPRVHALMGVGYRYGSITPWVAWSKQAIKITEYKMAKDRIEDQLVKKTTDLTESANGFAVGVNADGWIGDLGISGTLGLAAQKPMWAARIKYRFDMVTAHIGYANYPYLDIGKVIFGLGIYY